MMNVDAGRQHIRRLLDRPIVGETYPNAGGIYKVDRCRARSGMGTQAEGRLEVLRTRPCAVRCAGSGH